MKRISIILIAVLSLSAGLSGQNVDDALRYSQIFYGGTARFMSMGGAFTALGGDISSLSQNPAGIGVFRSSEVSLTPQLFNIRTKSSFNGTSNSDYLYNFNLNQVGIVSNIVSNTSDNGLINLNIGYSFNKTNNYNQTMIISGKGTNSSMADFWAGDGDGTLYNNLIGAPGIAYDAWIIDTLRGAGMKKYGTVFSNYGDNPPSVYGQTIRRLVSYEGYTGEHAFSIGGNYSNKLFFGATLGITQLRFTSNFQHTESTDVSIPSQFKNFNYTDHYEDNGTGYTLKLGAIYKPVDAVRIGVAFHTPTWFKIKEYLSESITSNFYDGGHYEFSDDPLRYEYALATPFRALAGVAVQIKKIGLVSADYEYVDYSTARFSQTGDNYDYSLKNMDIKNTLKAANNIRLGGELRLNNIYLRTGYGYYGKAFRSGEDNSNLDYRSLSFGAGFREQNVSVDFAYTNYKYPEKYVLYSSVDGSFDPAIANFSTVRNMFTVTLAYKFGY